MPNIKSAEKRIKITEKQNLRNRMMKSKVKTELKKFDAAIESGDLNTANELYPKAVGMVDRAMVKGVIHRNAASRKKAQIAKKLNSIKEA